MKEIRTIEDLTEAYGLEWIDYVEYLTDGVCIAGNPTIAALPCGDPDCVCSTLTQTDGESTNGTLAMDCSGNIPDRLGCLAGLAGSHPNMREGESTDGDSS